MKGRNRRGAAPRLQLKPMRLGLWTGARVLERRGEGELVEDTLGKPCERAKALGVAGIGRS